MKQQEVIKDIFRYFITGMNAITLLCIKMQLSREGHEGHKFLPYSFIFWEELLNERKAQFASFPDKLQDMMVVFHSFR